MTTAARDTPLVIDRSGSPIPAIYRGTAAGPAGPAVLMLHGTASQKNEVGDMFRRLAERLSEQGVRSLRIDFAGCGESPLPQTAFTVTSEVADAVRAFDWLADHSDVDPSRIAVVGFSQGGMVAAQLVSDRPAVAALVSWSSGDLRAMPGPTVFEELFLGADVDVSIDLGFRSFTFSRTWWDEFSQFSASAAVEEYTGPILAIAGDADDLVSPECSRALLDAAPSEAKKLIVLPEADHIFNVLDEESDQSSIAIEHTLDWLQEHLGRDSRVRRSRAAEH